MLDWDKYIRIANKFQYRARLQDRGDLKHNIIIALADANRQRNGNGSGNGHMPLPDSDLLKIAVYECKRYWRRLRKSSLILSLNSIIEESDGTIELIDCIPDDKIVDLDARLDARNWLLAAPKRLLGIAVKRVKGRVLTNKEHQYLWRFRHKKNLVAYPHQDMRQV